MKMTALTDAKALAPNAAAKAAIAVKGSDYATLSLLVQQHIVELNVLVKQLIALHSGDATTLTALNALLTELS
jgi:hypothetical protein